MCKILGSKDSFNRWNGRDIVNFQAVHFSLNGFRATVFSTIVKIQTNKRYTKNCLFMGRIVADIFHFQGIDVVISHCASPFVPLPTCSWVGSTPESCCDVPVCLWPPRWS